MILIIKYLIFILLLVHICIVLNVYVIVVVNNYFAIFAFLEKSLNRLIFRLSSGLPVWTRRLMGFLFFLIFLNWREKTLGWIYRSSKLCISQIFIMYLRTKLIFLLFIYCILCQALLFLKYLRLVLRNLLWVKIMILFLMETVLYCLLFIIYYIWFLIFQVTYLTNLCWMFLKYIFRFTFSNNFIRILNLCINKLSVIKCTFVMNMWSSLSEVFLLIFRILCWILRSILFFQRSAYNRLICTALSVHNHFTISSKIVWIFKFIL